MSEAAKALMEAQKSCKGLTKDGKNSYAKFSYVSIEEVVKTARDILHEFGLLFYPGEQTLHHAESESWISQTYVVHHVKSGENMNVTRTMVLPTEAKMSPCQMQGSAESYLLKNTLRELLLLPRFDEKEDIDSHDYSSGRARTPGNPRANRR